MSSSGERVLVVGGGLAGLTAACELLKRGCNVTIIEKERLGGNSSKATSGVAAPGSSFQELTSVDDFASLEVDANVTGESDFIKTGVQDLEWLSTSLNFSGDLELRHAPGHSVPRIIGTKERFPGMVMTYKTIQALQVISRTNLDRVRIVQHAEVKKLMKDGDRVVGLTYEKDGELVDEFGVVVVATGGYAGDSSPTSMLSKHRPDLVRLPTTNDSRSRGDGIEFSVSVGAATSQLDQIQLMPFALVDPLQENDSFKFVAADTIVGAGAILLNGKGERFCDEMGTHESISKAMMTTEGPFRMVIGETAAVRVNWLTEFYSAKGVMRKMRNVGEVASEVGVSSDALRSTLDSYCQFASSHANDGIDSETVSAQFLGNKRHFCGKVLGADEKIIDCDDNMYVATVTPALYSCGGGLVLSDGAVVAENGQAIPGLFAAGEVVAAPSQALWAMSGVPLLHAIVSGRSAGRAAADYLNAPVEVCESNELMSLIVGATLAPPTEVTDTEEKETVGKEIADMTHEELMEEVKKLRETGVVAKEGDAPAEEEEGEKTFTMAEVAKHNTQADAWVVINDMVIDVTTWIPIHPGGVQAICAFLGQDASDEWNTIHKPGTVEQKTKVEGGPKILGRVGNGNAAPKAGGAAAGGIPISEVAKHNKQGDAWVAINGKVYDVTQWIDVHPGGVQAICAFIGTDASDEWNTIHKPGTVEKNMFPGNPRGPKLLDELQGGGGGAPAGPVEESDPPPDGYGKVPGFIGAILYMVYHWLRLIMKTVFFTGNFHIDGDRRGTVRSAMFLVFFIVIHALGNLEIYLGADEYNGYAYFYKRLYWTGFGLEANIVEEYLAVCLFVHVCVALKRSYDISINYCLNTGKWNMLIAGLFTLYFLINHVQDFRFAKADMVPIRPPPYYFSFDGVLEGRFWFETPESGIEPVMVRDVAGLVFKMFASLGNCLWYTFFIVVFIYHVFTGWGKLAPSEVFFLPRDHVKPVTKIGQGLVLCLGAIYLSFPWTIYFTGMK